jgi:RND family efflux transporter MFP subunit
MMQRPAATVSVAQAKTADIASILIYAGAVQSRATVNVVPKSSGRIEKMHVDVGSVVKKGDLIAELDHSSLDAAVLQAEASLETAQIRLDTYKTGGRPEDVAAAQAAVDAAQARLAGMQSGRAESIASAQAAVDSAQARLDAVTSPYTKADIDAQQTVVAQAETALQTAQTNLYNLQNPDSTSVRNAQIAVDKAKNNLNQTYINRDLTCSRSGKTSAECQAANAGAAAAAKDVETAQSNLSKLLAGPRQADLAQAQAAVQSAQTQLDGARQKLAEMKAGPKQTDVDQAQAALDQARQLLALQKVPSSPSDIAAQQAAVRQAQEQVALKATPYTDNDLRTAHAGVTQAMAALEVAKTARADANIVAPFDGVVSARLIAEGGFTSSNAPFVTLVSNDVEVVFNLEEANLAKIQVDMPVMLTTSAYPGQKFSAKIALVNPTADSKARTFTVKVAPNVQDGKLKGGMFADVAVTAEQKSGVVVVPRDAIVAKGTKQVLYTVSNGVASQKDIKIGITDDKNVEIIAGVSAGDQVVVQGQATLNDGDPVRVAEAGDTRIPGAAPGGVAVPKGQ